MGEVDCQPPWSLPADSPEPLKSVFHFDVLLVSCLPQVCRPCGVCESQRLCVSHGLVGHVYDPFHLTS